MERVVHVTAADEWARARESGRYGEELVEREGFLHMCRPEQLPGVLERFFGGEVDGLVGLVLDAAALGEALRWERAEPGGERFPHLYRALAVDEVQQAPPIAELLARLAPPNRA